MAWPAACFLATSGGLRAGFRHSDDAHPDDGWLEVGVATANGPLQWARTLGRIVAGRTDDSPFVCVTRARRIVIRLAAPRTYELDGGSRGMTDRISAHVVPHAVAICVPPPAHARQTVMCRSLWQRRPSGADRRGVPRRRCVGVNIQGRARRPDRKRRHRARSHRRADPERGPIRLAAVARRSRPRPHADRGASSRRSLVEMAGGASPVRSG